jgi:hypothetical protein
MTDTAPRDTRVFYRDIKPYDVPDQLEQLQGPHSARIELPRNVYWGPEAVVDLDTEGGVMKAYQAALREGRVVDQVELLNRDLLIEVWGELMLPDRVREVWESGCPELAGA